MRRSVSARCDSKARFAWRGDEAGPSANSFESKPENRNGGWFDEPTKGSFSLSASAANDWPRRTGEPMMPEARERSTPQSQAWGHAPLELLQGVSRLGVGRIHKPIGRIYANKRVGRRQVVHNRDSVTSLWTRWIIAASKQRDQVSSADDEQWEQFTKNNSRKIGKQNRTRREA